MAPALVFRLIDKFVLRLDERLGEIILSKALGFALVVPFRWLAGRKLRDSGLHSKGLVPSLLIGTSIALVVLVVDYATELRVLSGSAPTLQFANIDLRHKTFMHLLREKSIRNFAIIRLGMSISYPSLVSQYFIPDKDTAT